MTVQQTVEDYVAGQHARSGLSLETMAALQAAQFDSEMKALLLSFAQDSLLTLNVVAGIIWGKPLSGKS
ncbi:MAG TPA: hypothetical protein VKV40_15825 [Ktedonobacteraceae bacterium]|nr:hypothetical protein [Ktedonobacteraceae bacterium]